VVAAVAVVITMATVVVAEAVVIGIAHHVVKVAAIASGSIAAAIPKGCRRTISSITMM
jgi:hypothetical protein